MSNVEKEYTINGKVYRLVEEEKKPERLEGYVFNDIFCLAKMGGAWIKVVEIKEGEVIVSRDDVIALLERYYFSNNNIGAVLKELGL